MLDPGLPPAERQPNEASVSLGMEGHHDWARGLTEIPAGARVSMAADSLLAPQSPELGWYGPLPSGAISRTCT